MFYPLMTTAAGRPCSRPRFATRRIRSVINADADVVALAFIIDVDRKRTEANMIAGPAWMLDGRTFAAATGAASAGA